MGTIDSGVGRLADAVCAAAGGWAGGEIDAKPRR